MFKEALERIVERTEGSLGALIMGTDGIAVEKALLPEGSDANIDVAATEVTSLVRNAQRAGHDIGLGGLREFVITFETMTIIARLFTRDYFVLLALNAHGNIGRGRFELRKAELDLAREFAV
ncbi:MAG TPA: roadblock/LC7 domain-containing protein [Pyrinomonadaceae bacterium]|nr:roadblock/LC7 domain-containing protein [Pyrinomonadaceae bacterium]